MPVEAAPWWNPDSPQDGKPLVRHAPTLHNYHTPDERQRGLIRSGIGSPIVVPKATADGGSPAFNANEPGVVHVDPDAPDGGAIVDLTHLDRRAMKTALARSNYPHQVFYELGVAPSLVGKGFNRPAEAAPGPARQNPLMPNDYVVPKAAQDGGQAGYAAHPPALGPTVTGGYAPPLPTPAFAAALESPMLPPVPQLPTAPAPVAAPVAAPAAAPPQVQQYAPAPPQPAYQPPPQPPYQPYPAFAPPPAPAVDPAFLAMMGQMQQTLSGLTAGLGAVTQKVNDLAAAPARPAAPPPSLAARARSRPAEDNPYAQDARTGTFDGADARPIPRGRQAEEEGVGSRRDDKAWDLGPAEPRQTLSDLRRDDEPREGIIVGFEALKLPYVVGPRGVKPRRQVFFALPQVGNHAVRYHDVIVAKNNITLVYDTRYEDGDMYVPPELGDTEVSVHVPHLKKTFKVASIGLLFSLGVFDLVVLPKHAEEALDMGQE